MKASSSTLLLLIAIVLAACTVNTIVEASSSSSSPHRNPTPFSDQFKVVIDNSAYKKKKKRHNNNNRKRYSNIDRSLCSKQQLQQQERNIRNRLKNLVPSDQDVKEWYEQTRKTTARLAKKVSKETKEFWDKCQTVVQQYSKAEIGMYTSLACALTFAMQAVFAKTPCKTLDVGIITYILSQQAANDYMTLPELELKRKRRSLKLYTTSSIFSNDGKTYIRFIKKQKRTTPRTTTFTDMDGTTIPLPAVQLQESQFYSEAPLLTSRNNKSLYDESSSVVPPASHNAVYSTMTPYMRQKLKARRMRGGGGRGVLSSGVIDRLVIAFYFAAWYFLNIVYNIINKKVLNVLPAPLMVGTFQFGIGALYCALVWLIGLRPMPRLTSNGQAAVANVGMYHALGQLASMISLGAGPVSFTHIVKAMEPFFSAVVSGLYFHKWMKPQVYATLIPVVCGVGYACMKEINFSWLAFGAAMCSNLFFALRAVMSKMALTSGTTAGTNLTPPNMFGLVTLAAFVFSIPAALLGEGKGFAALWKTALATVGGEDEKMTFYQSLVVSGLVHYLNNEVMYMALGKVHPVTLAVGNTMKRVFILVASVMVFQNPITVQAGIGSGVGISGVLLYSLTKQYYEKLEAEEEAAAAKSNTGTRIRKRLPRLLGRKGE